MVVKEEYDVDRGGKRGGGGEGGRRAGGMVSAES